MCDENFFSCYPDEDYSKEVFQFSKKNTSQESQIFVHRESSLIYYVYTRKVNAKRPFVIGLCMLLNGSFCFEFEKLFTLFDNITSDILIRQLLVQLNSNGEFELQRKRLFEIKNEINRLFSIMSSELESSKIKTSLLPAQDFSSNNNNVVMFDLNEEEEQEIVDSTFTNSYTQIVKSNQSEIASVAVIQNIIRGLNDKINSLTNNYNKLKKEKARLVVIAFIPWIFILIGVGVSYHNYKIQSEETTQLMQNDIDGLNTEVYEKNETINDLKNKLDEANVEMDTLRSRLSVCTFCLDSTKHLADSLSYLSDSLINLIRGSQNEDVNETGDRRNGYSVSKYPIYVSNPIIGRTKSNGVKIRSISLYENHTVVNLVVECRSAGGLNIDSDTYILCDGIKHKLINTSNIEMSPKTQRVKYGDVLNCSLRFERIPADAKVIDLIEPGDSPWKWYNIRIQ